MKKIMPFILVLLLFNIGTVLALQSQATVIGSESETTTATTTVPETTPSTIFTEPPHDTPAYSYNPPQTTTPVDPVIKTNINISKKNTALNATSVNHTYLNQTRTTAVIENENPENKNMITANIVSAKTKNYMDIISSMVLRSSDGNTFYDVEGKRIGSILGLIPVTLTIRAHVNAESGEVYNIQRPWWSFLVL